MPFKAALWKEGDKLLLQTGYNIVLVNLLNTLPSKECAYRDETHTWYIDAKHEASVINWLKKLGYLITQVDQPVPTGDDSFAIMGLLPTATWEVCEAAYKALCKVNHPDAGGNVEVMQQINEAWQKIKAAKGK
jgi:hypothetical protein